MADDSLSVLSLNPKEDEQLTETAFAERTFFFPRPFWKIYADFLFDLHHFAAFGSKKQKCLRTGILRRKKAKKMVHPTRFELMTFYSGGRRKTAFFELDFPVNIHFRKIFAKWF